MSGPPRRLGLVALALYRKYRPATFKDVVGQEHVTEPLRRALESGRINHAYLFSGPRGCGKTSSARILARSLNCEQGPTPDPCGVCSSCIALAPEGPGSLDVVELDAASHGGVDDTRELRDRAFYMPAESRYRVFIIDEAHMVSNQGFNALLKIVEEPPDHLVFIFATTEPEKVIPTIRSRTHHYPFHLLPPQTLRGLLEKLCGEEGVQVEPAVYPLVVKAGAGSARDSLSVMDQLLAGAGSGGVTYADAVALLGVTDAALLDEMVDALAAGDGAHVFSAIEKVAEAGHDPRRFAADLLGRLRDLVILQAVPDAPDKGLIDEPADEVAAMVQQSQRLPVATLTRFAEILHTGLTDMRGTTSPRLILELLAARMLLPAATLDDAGLLQRLERVERRLDIVGEHGSDGAAAAPAVGAVRSEPAVVSDAAAVTAAPATGSDTAPRATSSLGLPTPPVLSGARAAAESAAADSASPRDGAGHASPGPAAAHDEPESDARQDPHEEPPGSESVSSESASREPSETETAAGQVPDPVQEAPRGRAPDDTPGAASDPPRGHSDVVPQPAPDVEPQQTGAAVASDATETTSAAAVGVTDVRGLWPQVLELVKQQNRTAHALLESAGITVVSVDAGVLLLSTKHAALARMISEPRNSNLVRDVLQGLIGVEWRVRCVTDDDPAARPIGRTGPAGGAAPRGASAPSAGPEARGNRASAHQGGGAQAEQASDASSRVDTNGSPGGPRGRESHRQRSAGGPVPDEEPASQAHQDTENGAEANPYDDIDPDAEPGSDDYRVIDPMKMAVELLQDKLGASVLSDE